MASSRVSFPQNVEQATMPSGSNMSVPIGVIVTDPGNLSTHGVNSDEEKKNIKSCSACGFFDYPWMARMVIEFSATMSLYFVLSLARVLNPQSFFFYSSYNVAFVGLAMVFINVVLFGYATGVSMSVPGSLLITFSNWVIRGIRSGSSEEKKLGHNGNHDLVDTQYYYDFGRLVSMWFCQILGGYVGVILAIVVFLQGATNEFYTIAELMTPNFGLATWLGGPLLVTSWQVSGMNFVGSFIIHAALLYAFCVDKLYKKQIWAGFVRGGAYFVAIVLFYVQTGAAFDMFSWLIPASLNMAFSGTHQGSGELFAYLLAPVAGGVAAALFVWFWVWISQSTNLKHNIAIQKENHKQEKKMYKRESSKTPLMEKEDSGEVDQTPGMNSATSYNGPVLTNLKLGQGMPPKY